MLLSTNAIPAFTPRTENLPSAVLAAVACQRIKPAGFEEANFNHLSHYARPKNFLLFRYMLKKMGIFIRNMGNSSGNM